MPVEDSLQASSSDQTGEVAFEMMEDSLDDDSNTKNDLTYRKIIDYVKDIPVLWQRSHADFQKPAALKPVWEKMSRDLEADESTLKRKWKDIKDRFRRIYIKLLINPDKAIHWNYFNDLSFLHENYYIKEEMLAKLRRLSKLSRTGKLVKEHTDGSETPITSIRTKNTEGKTNKAISSMNVCKSQEMTLQNDSDYMYLMSILPQVKSLTELQKLQFRTLVHDCLLELYIQNEYANT